MELNIDTAEKSMKAISYLLTFLLIVSLCQAITWNQYTPSPSTELLEGVVSLSNGYAYASTLNLGKCYLYNTISWDEIQCPDDALSLGGYTDVLSQNPFIYDQKGIQKTNNRYVYMAYRNPGNNQAKIIKYNPTTNTYTEEIFITNMTIDATSSFVCIEEDNECYISSTTSGEVARVIPSFHIISTTSATYPIQSNKKLVAGEGASPYYLAEWNGINWVNKGGRNPLRHLYNTAQERAICTNYAYGSIWWYDYSSSTFPSASSNTGIGCLDAEKINGKLYYSDAGIGGGYYIEELNWGSNSPTLSFDAGRTVYSIDYDETSGIGWAVGNNGFFWKTIVGGGGGGTYTVTPSISSNPSVYGSQVIFYCQVTHPEGKSSNIVLEIRDANDTNIITTITQNNIPSGTNQEMFTLTTNSAFWSNYPEGGYVYHCEATTTDLSQSGGNAMFWDVILGEMTNETTYNLEDHYIALTSLFDGLNSVTALGEDDAFATIRKKSNNALYVLSFDSSSNTITDAITNSTLQDMGTANPTTAYSISVGDNDRLFIGTDDQLYTLTGASNLRANQLTFESNNALPSEYDIFTDTEAVNDATAYVCQDGRGLETDDIYRYNANNNTFGNDINYDPCKSIKIIGNYIVASRGANNGLDIYDLTNKNLESEIATTNTISNYATHDLIDILDGTNDYLYAITGKNEIKKYDITNKASPVEEKKCRLTNTYAMTDITSIEAIDENTVIIGGYYHSTNDVIGLLICDFLNNDTYNSGGAYYEAQILTGKGNKYGIITEIQKMNSNGKFHTAEQTAYGIYYFSKTIAPIPINNAPSISQVTKTTTTPCKNEIVEFEIIATDPDTADHLSYALSCTGGTATSWTAYNKFTCSYSTTGTKNINAFAKDNHEAQAPTNSFTINVQDCNQTNPTSILFEIKDGSTAQSIDGATINLYDGNTLISTKNTNSNGYADFTSISTYKQYRAEITANNYAPKTEYFYPAYTRYIRYLDSTFCANCTTQRTLLIVTVTDSNDAPLENVLVATLDPVTGASKYGLTDFSGSVYLLDVEPSGKMIVGAKKEGYPPTSLYTSIGIGEQKSITIKMGEQKIPYEFTPTERGCSDTIKEVIICGNRTTSGIGNSCTTDADCITGRCSLAISQSARTCSTFNYTLCDVQGINRGNTCIFRNISLGILKGIGNFILDYFLYVLIIVLLIVGALIIRRSLTH